MGCMRTVAGTLYERLRGACGTGMVRTACGVPAWMRGSVTCCDVAQCSSVRRRGGMRTRAERVYRKVWKSVKKAVVRYEMKF